MIVVTGVGAVSPAGTGAQALWSALTDRAGTPCAAPDLDPAATLGPKGLRLLDRATLLALVAAHFALDEAGLLALAPGWEGMRAPGLVLGTSFGSLSSVAAYVRTRLEHGVAALNPSLFPNTVMNSPASQTAIRFGLRALCTTVATGWASGAEAIGMAADALRHGRADLILAGGVDDGSPDNLAVYADLGLDPPVGWGEGACLLVLERHEDAAKRGARVLARLAGWSSGFGEDGLEEAVRVALYRSRDRDDLACELPVIEWPIDLIVQGANGLPRIGQAESRAFGTYRGPKIALKERLGECDGAGGALAAALAVLSCRRGTAPGYNSEVRSALVSAPSYTGHAAALRFTRMGG